MASRDQLTDLDFKTVSKVLNLPNASASGDAVPFGQMQALIEGNNWKDSVRAASTANLTVSGPGATIDGVTMTNGDRVLLKDQTTQSQNGIYIFNGAAAALTRASDMDVAAEFEAAVVRVEEGTVNAGTKWAQTQVNITVGSSNVIFVSDSGSAPAASETQAGVAEIATQAETDTGTDDVRMITPLKLKTSKFFTKSFSQTIGDASATSFNIDHNFNSRDVVVEVYRNSGSYDTVIATVERPTVNRVTVVFNAAPASNAFRVVVQGIDTDG